MSASEPITFCVAGSRRYGPLSKVTEFVASVHAKYPTAILANGLADGVDRAALLAAQSLGMTRHFYRADWDTHKSAAGFLRNEKMLRESDHVVAFWDEFSRGTAHMICAAANAKKLRAVYGAQGTEIDLTHAVLAARKIMSRRPHKKPIPAGKRVIGRLGDRFST